MSSHVYQEEGDDEIDLWLKVIADKRMAFHDCFTRVPGGGWRWNWPMVEGVSWQKWWRFMIASHVYQEKDDDEIDLWLKAIADKRMAFRDCFTRVPGRGRRWNWPLVEGVSWQKWWRFMIASHVYQEEGDDEIDLWLNAIADKNDGVSWLLQTPTRRKEAMRLNFGWSWQLEKNYGVSCLSSNYHVYRWDQYLLECYSWQKIMVFHDPLQNDGFWWWDRSFIEVDSWKKW